MTFRGVVVGYMVFMLCVFVAAIGSSLLGFR